MLGRPRIAQEIHERNGSYAINPNRQNKQAPKADGKEPEMPEYFGEDECRKWIELVEDLRRNGILSRDTREILIAYCTAYGGWMKARRAVEQSGLVLASRDEDGNPSFKRNPFCVELHKYRDEMNGLLTEFGLTPASRQRCVSFAEQESDPFHEWLAGAGSG